VRIISVVAMRLDVFSLLYIGLKPDATTSVVAMPLISGRLRNINYFIKIGKIIKCCIRFTEL
jgi:hypothetical protein